jgi:hypothetical protein
MFTLFLFCAVIGGTFLACQIAMTLMGVGGDTDVDVPSDIGDVGDLDLDVGGDVDAGGDVDVDDSTAGFRVISFRTLIAGMAFFGLGGLGADATSDSPLIVWAVALGCGAGAMYLVYWIFRILYSLGEEGTVHITNAVGRHGTVYLRIPGHDSGAGKIQLNLQSRTTEYLAMTAGEELPTGTKIIVVDVLTPSTVQVEPVLEPERSDHE